MTEQNIQQQKQFRILLIGDDCQDVYQYGIIDRLSPEAPVPVFIPGKKETKPGMAGNVAKNLEEDLIETKRLHKLIEELVLDKTTITKEQIKDIHNHKRDWYISPGEALKYKIIDQII